MSADTRPIASLAGTTSVPEKKGLPDAHGSWSGRRQGDRTRLPMSDVGQCVQHIEEPLDVGRGSCTDDRHDDGRRRHLEVDSVVCEELCARLVAGPPGRVSITMRKESRATTPSDALRRADVARNRPL